MAISLPRASSSGLRRRLLPAAVRRAASVFERPVAFPAPAVPEPPPARREPTLPAGTLLKQRFVLGAPIAQGGTSTIYHAVDHVRLAVRPALAEVAIKLAPAGTGAFQSHGAAMIHREGLILQELSHPNVVRAFDIDGDAGASFMVMEYLRGCTVSDIFRRAPERRVSPGVALTIVKDVGAALHHCHSRGIIHADVKPNNVFVTDQGEIKLIDFGVARPMADQDEDEALVAYLQKVGAFTPAYCSPELLEGESPAETDDVFSLSVMLYLMVSGAHPFGGRDALDALHSGLAPRKPADMPRQIWQAVERGLALDADRRTQSVAAFLADLFKPGLIGRLWR